MKAFVSCLGLILFLPLILPAQNALQKAVDRFVNDPVFQPAQVSVSVLEVESGRLLAGHDADKLLLPASSLKVFVTATALEVLGPDFRFDTYLQYDGAIDESGTLRGNIYIKGTGDPTLASDQFGEAMAIEELMAQWVAAIQKRGINTIDGQIIGDGSHFEYASTGRTWPWEDIGNYYGAGVWGLNFHENLYYLHFQQEAKLGATPEIATIEPHIPNLLLVNEVKSAAKGTGDNAYIFGSPYAYTRFVRGTIPVGNRRFSIKGSIPDPPFFVAYQLLTALEAKGIKVTQSASTQFERQRTGKGDRPRNTFYTYQSAPLAAIVREANQMSINLYCESLLKSIGKRQQDEGSTEAGIKAMKTYWSDKGLSMEDCFIQDGSGLSVRNAVSSRQLAQVIQWMAKTYKGKGPFFESLPLAAKTGTLRYMFKGTKAAGKLRAKSGGMERVRSYTGYTVNGQGKALAFSIIANNFTVKSSQIRQGMERLMIAICD
ncbi:MAG: D-alanyl-D-alanine carboxypeptidase/D-alanyl-D-alanine-endopeptidase [Bacteroidota bacterium]